ncbi:MAG: hypothetical protein QX189_02815, partial [Methylococcales bacterium]
DGLRHFYKQLLFGDRADNIFGVDKIGKVKAGRLIDPLNDEADMLTTVQDLYDSEERLLINGQCLWIWRKENDLWQLPT